ncbi:MAG: sodium:proton antiporter [Alphaproteobacteria bacterium]|nr:sodium:proton antiporter [Alphaproteobacteria bacterium]OJV13134.1 MAG: sodium:proton antiporter [Alphaproteobacteria bacterium 33-17]
MAFLSAFTPILIFVSLFVGSGIYYTSIGTENAFYQLSPLVAIIPAIMVGWVNYKGNSDAKMNAFLDGVRHKDIIAMCIIFLLAGAFSEVTKAIGSTDATVNLAISFIPSKFLLIGIFLTAAFISTAIGTSMGTIATIAPIAAGLSAQADIMPALAIGTVVGGAMFGDNLSLISDTTIASIMSQEADFKKKLKLNAKVAIVASIITIIFLLMQSGTGAEIQPKDYNFILVTPYLLLIILALTGINVFVVLIASIIFSCALANMQNPDHALMFISSHITKGFSSVHEIMLLSLMVGGLSGLAGKANQHLAEKISVWIKASGGGMKMSQFLIAKTVSIFNLLLANNTIAIIFSGEIAKDISRKQSLPAHYSAAWLDIFSCVIQGIIPYGAQILLASTVAKVSPLSVTPYVYYCFILGLVTIAHILYFKPKDE